MKGNIHGIWFTKKDGMLHPAILPNLASMVAIARSHNFNIVFWTNFNEVKPTEIESLQAAGIIVKDHAECQTSRFYNYFLSFLNRGIEGDTVAFALASDILRTSLLELTPDDEYYIYADSNDISILTLNDNLSNLDGVFKKTSWGFFFPIHRILFNHIIPASDVFLALKNINLSFFNAFFNAYEKNLHDTIGNYYAPTSNTQALEIGVDITAQTTKFFTYYADPLVIKANFGDFESTYSEVSCLEVFPFKRNLENSRTWLPVDVPVEQESQDFLKTLQTELIAVQKLIKTKYAFYADHTTESHDKNT